GGGRKLPAKLSSPNGPSGAIYRKTKLSSQKCDETGQKLVIKRKALWKNKAIRTNRVNLALPNSKAANRKSATNRNVNASSASAKSKAVVANRAVAANKADDRPSCLGLTGGGRRLPPL